MQSFGGFLEEGFLLILQLLPTICKDTNRSIVDFKLPVGVSVCENLCPTPQKPYPCLTLSVPGINTLPWPRWIKHLNECSVLNDSSMLFNMFPKHTAIRSGRVAHHVALKASTVWLLLSVGRFYECKLMYLFMFLQNAFREEIRSIKIHTQCPIKIQITRAIDGRTVVIGLCKCVKTFLFTMSGVSEDMRRTLQI